MTPLLFAAIHIDHWHICAGSGVELARDQGRSARANSAWTLSAASRRSTSIILGLEYAFGRDDRRRRASRSRPAHDRRGVVSDGIRVLDLSRALRAPGARRPWPIFAPRSGRSRSRRTVTIRGAGGLQR